jgi:hypothetical protein
MHFDRSFPSVRERSLSLTPIGSAIQKLGTRVCFILGGSILQLGREMGSLCADWVRDCWKVFDVAPTSADSRPISRPLPKWHVAAESERRSAFTSEQAGPLVFRSSHSIGIKHVLCGQLSSPKERTADVGGAECVVSVFNGRSSHFCINKSKRHHRPLLHI